MDPVIDDKSKAGAESSPASKNEPVAREQFESSDIPVMTETERAHWQQTGELPKAVKKEESAASAPPAKKAEEKSGEPSKETKSDKEPESGTGERREMKPQEIRVKQLLGEKKVEKERADKAEAELARLKQPAKPAEETKVTRPAPDDKNDKGEPKYPTMRDFVEALTKFDVDHALAEDRKATADRIAKEDREKRIALAQERWDKQATESRKTHKDFDSIIEGLDVVPGSVLDAYLANSDNAAELHYLLAKSPDEMKRIDKLNPIEQVRAFAFLEKDITPKSKPSTETKVVSDAPTPPRRVETERGAAPDPIAAAIEKDDFVGYATAANERDIKSRKG